MAPSDVPAHADRAEAFQQFAERRATGSVEVPPLLLGDRERRLHVRHTLLEDHRIRIANRPEAAATKFDMLAASPFSFYRGTALLYYRDHAGTDGHLPAVFTIGDVHPENFGVMPSADGTPFFGANDFDEAWIAPFTYDVNRGAVGFWMAGTELGLKRKERRAAVLAFVDGYLEALREFLDDDRESHHQFRVDNSPPMIRALLEESLRGRDRFLRKRVDLEALRFLPSDKVIPQSATVEAFQEVVDAYVKKAELGGPPRPKDFFRVLDVGRKIGSGTASQGLDRFWMLLQGWSDAPEDCVVLEMKQARRSALYGLVPAHGYEAKTSAERIIHAHSVFLVGGDPLYGAAEIDGTSFLARERSPLKKAVEVAELDGDGLIEYADVCGRALAQPHARSDEDTGMTDACAEELILGAIKPEVFRADVVAFAQDAAARIYADHELFCQDHALGAFRTGEIPG